MEDKDLFDFCGHSDEMLLLLIKNTLFREVKTEDFSLLFKISNKSIFVKNWWNNGDLFIV